MLDIENHKELNQILPFVLRMSMYHRIDHSCEWWKSRELEKEIFHNINFGDREEDIAARCWVARAHFEI